MIEAIERTLELEASPQDVWRALTDSAEFGEWFRVMLDGPFQLGEVIVGRITHPGCEHMVFRAKVEAMDSERRFALWWHPFETDEAFGSEPTTLVEFIIEETDGGTHLTVTESGFDALPEDRRAMCFQRNEGGWTGQMDNIRKHVDG